MAVEQYREIIQQLILELAQRHCRKRKSRHKPFWIPELVVRSKHFSAYER